MQVLVVVPSALRRFSDGQTRVEVDLRTDDACTLADVLDVVSQRYPGVGARVLDEQGHLRRHVNVFVDAEESRALGGLHAPVVAGTEIVILPAVSGGTD
jgi:molybdopterin converting factor small subunit